MQIFTAESLYLLKGVLSPTDMRPAELVAVIAVAEREPSVLLNYVCPRTEIETVLYESSRSPACAGDSNNTLVTLIAAIPDPDSIPIRCDEDAQAIWSR